MSICFIMHVLELAINKLLFCQQFISSQNWRYHFFFWFFYCAIVWFICTDSLEIYIVDGFEKTDHILSESERINSHIEKSNCFNYDFIHPFCKSWASPLPAQLSFFMPMKVKTLKMRSLWLIVDANDALCYVYIYVGLRTLISRKFMKSWEKFSILFSLPSSHRVQWIKIVGNCHDSKWNSWIGWCFVCSVFNLLFVVVVSNQRKKEWYFKSNDILKLTIGNAIKWLQMFSSICWKMCLRHREKLTNKQKTSNHFTRWKMTL